jgi:energy-coupling factor transporter ATP-binding protein EcfA2
MDHRRGGWPCRCRDRRTLAAGSTVALAGENGWGKTTLVKLLLGRLVQGGERAGCYSSAAPTISDRDLYPLTRASGARKAHPKSVC